MTKNEVQEWRNVMNNYFKNFILILLVSIMFMLNSCSKFQNDTKKKITCVVDPAPSRKAEIKGFEEDNPNLRVDLNYTANSQSALLTQIAGNVPPDVITIYSPAALRVFMEKDALLELTPYIKKFNLDMNDF